MAAGVSAFHGLPGSAAQVAVQVRGATERFALAVLGCTGVGKSALSGRFLRHRPHPQKSDRHLKPPWCQG